MIIIGWLRYGGMWSRKEEIDKSWNRGGGLYSTLAHIWPNCPPRSYPPWFGDKISTSTNFNPRLDTQSANLGGTLKKPFHLSPNLITRQPWGLVLPLLSHFPITLFISDTDQQLHSTDYEENCKWLLTWDIKLTSQHDSLPRTILLLVIYIYVVLFSFAMSGSLPQPTAFLWDFEGVELFARGRLSMARDLQ